MVQKQCHKDERQIRAVNGKEPKLNFMNYRKKHSVILKQSLIWLLKSQLKHWSVASHISIFVSRMEIYCFSAVPGASTAASILICLVLIFFCAFHCWDFLPLWLTAVSWKVLLENCKDYFSNYILEAFCKPGLPSMASVISSFIISLSIPLTLPSLLTLVWDLPEKWFLRAYFSIMELEITWEKDPDSGFSSLSLHWGGFSGLDCLTTERVYGSLKGGFSLLSPLCIV